MRRVWNILDPAALLWAAGILALLAAAGGVAGAFATRAGSGEGIPLGTLVIGQLMLGLVLATVAGVAWPASIAAASPRATPRTWLGFAVLADTFGVWLVALALMTGRLGAGDVLRLYLLFAAWLALWTAVGVLLRPLGSGYSLVAPAMVALLMLALPVVVTPVFRAAAETGGVGAVERLTPWVTNGCPTLGMLAAVRESQPYEWTHTPVMYVLTPLGQDWVLPLPVWRQARIFRMATSTPVWSPQLLWFAGIALVTGLLPVARRWVQGRCGRMPDRVPTA